jgi:hypothetical protein
MSATGSDLRQIKQHIIRPTLAEMSPHHNTSSAVNLLAFTFLKESNGGRYVMQLGGGPAIGPFQMEPATHDDCWRNFLVYQPDLARIARSFARGSTESAEQMAGNWYCGCFMARIKYIRDSAPLPAHNDAKGIVEYWKRVYNTHLGAGRVDAATIALARVAIAA